MPLEYLTIEHLSLKDIIRLFSKIEVSKTRFWNSTPCWEWTARLSPKGYGAFSYKNKSIAVHRFVHAWLVAPIPKGQEHGEIDHRCDNEGCCSPMHTKFVSGWENFIRSNSIYAQNARKTLCEKGHAFTENNTRITPLGSRVCRQCRREYNSRTTKERRASDSEWAEKERKRKREYQAARFANDPLWRERRRASRVKAHLRRKEFDSLNALESTVKLNSKTKE